MFIKTAIAMYAAIRAIKFAFILSKNVLLHVCCIVDFSRLTLFKSLEFNDRDSHQFDLCEINVTCICWKSKQKKHNAQLTRKKNNFGAILVDGQDLNWI